MASNESSSSRGYISADMDLEKDDRPEHSPYASEACTVLFQDGKSLCIPRDFLEQIKKLHIYVIRGSPGLKVHFNHVTSATGHVLLHFLACGIYQCLKPQGDCLEERHVSEFKTALDVYVAADSLQIPRLRDLARREITRVGDSLSLPSVISTIEDSGLSFKTLPGVTAYVESRILSFGEDATPAAIDSMLSELEGPNTLSRTLLKSMVLLKSSELFKQQQKLHENEGRIDSGTVASVLNNEMRMRRMSPTEQAMKEAEAKAEVALREEKMLPLAERAYYEEEEAVAEEAPAEEVPAEEPVCQEQARLDEQEINDLLDKKAKRGGRLMKKDKMRLKSLLRRPQIDLALVEVAQAALLGGVTAAPWGAPPAVDDLEIPESPIDVSGDGFGTEADETSFPTCWGSDDPGQDSDEEVVENRPHRSPYASDIVALRFSPSQTLRIPRQFLDKTPLATRLEQCEPLNQIDLGSIQFDAGHVIVNFLVTGKYQCLEPWGTTAVGKYSSEFRTALRVYMAAESLGLRELFELAQEEAKKAGDKLSFPQIVDNVHFLDPFHAHFPWIGEYVKSRMISFWQTTTDEQAAKMTSDVPGPSNLHKILIGGLLKLKKTYYAWSQEEDEVIKDLGREIQEGRDLLHAVRRDTDVAYKEFLRLEEEIQQKMDLARYLEEDEDVKEHLDLIQKKLDLRKLKATVLSSGSRKEQEEPHLEKPEVASIQETPDLPPKKSLKDVEEEAVLEQSELRSLISKRIDKQGIPLAFPLADQKRLTLLEQKNNKRADVLNAKRDWDRIHLQEEKADTAWKDLSTNVVLFGGSQFLFYVYWPEDA
ncbi:hypothetical protein CEP54_002136 [Fusarium duplospermum]|uniref:Uncharacterized protein n=1 Tax=Fusarium duplospermum TaxID=1325734 RepID=A0A428QWN3_9HYPO|nr:hypothetical protein CEP54_002136 [Fusarium duplospermum]